MITAEKIKAAKSKEPAPLAPGAENAAKSKVISSALMLISLSLEPLLYIAGFILYVLRPSETRLLAVVLMVMVLQAILNWAQNTMARIAFTPRRITSAQISWLRAILKQSPYSSGSLIAGYAIMLFAAAMVFVSGTMHLLLFGVFAIFALLALGVRAYRIAGYTGVKGGRGVGSDGLI